VLRSWSPARVPAFGSSSCRIRSAVIWMEVSIPAFPGMLVPPLPASGLRNVQP
jgi:hypothetical protein